jgi:hypothetical protein
MDYDYVKIGVWNVKGVKYYYVNIYYRNYETYKV